MPTNEYEKVVEIFHNKFRSSDSFGCQQDPVLCYFRTKCQTVYPKLKNLKFQLGDDFDFNVPPEDYLIAYQENGYDYCILGLSGADYGLYILGDAFLRSYLSVYDFENKRAGLVLHKYSKGVITLHDDGMDDWAVSLIVITTLLGISSIGLWVNKKLRNKRLQNMIQREEESLMGYNNRV